MAQSTDSLPAPVADRPRARPKATGTAPPAGTRPFARFEWMIAGRYLRARRREAFISVIAGFSFIGIMLGVATLIIVMAVMNGFRAQLIDKILGLNGHLIVQPIDGPLTDYGPISDRIALVNGVVSVVPLVEGQALASGTDVSSGVIVRGVRDQDLPKVRGVADNVRLGTLEGFSESDGVAIGTRLAGALGLTIGSSITIVSPRGNVTPMGVTPRIKAYPVVAIFEIGMSEYDSSFVFMPFAEAQAYFNLEDEASAIEIYVANPDAVDGMRPAIEEAADRQIMVTDWQQRNMTFFSALQVERNVMFLILSLIILIAALNIISGLTMLVKEKGHAIAILRTMGASRGAIMRIFFIIGSSIGTIGTLAGFLLGVLISLNIETLRGWIAGLTASDVFSPELYFLSQLPAEMDARETITVIIMALGLSFLATIYPAWRAARLDPVQALRYE
jgi:lipoprotein-releasing system permease protein